MSLPPRILTPLIIACALFMENMDSTVIATSLPAIAIDLQEDPVALKLALTSYLISLAVFIPASGWIADRFGARTIFCSAIAVFTLGSILCGFSGTLAAFVLARALQGLGGAMMVPVGRLILLRSVPKSEILNALAWLTVPALIGPVIGPPVGGFITTYFHWRWIFWLNVPIGVIGIGLAWTYIANIRDETPTAFDFTGFLLTAAGLSCVMFGLTVAGRGFISNAEDAALISIGVIALILYVRHARVADNALIDLRLLALPTFRHGITGGFLFRVGIGAIPFLLPLMLQLTFGLSPFASGSLTFAAAAGALVMKIAAPPILKRLGFRRVLIGNAILSTVFLALNAAFTITTPHWIILLILLAGGFLRSLQFTSVNAIIFSDISNADMGKATSFSGAAQQLSISMGVALGAAALEISHYAGGRAALETSDFAFAFLVVAAVSLLSAPVFRRLAKDAGAHVSGRRVKSEEAAAASAG